MNDDRMTAPVVRSQSPPTPVGPTKRRREDCLRGLFEDGRCLKARRVRRLAGRADANQDLDHGEKSLKLRCSWNELTAQLGVHWIEPLPNPTAHGPYPLGAC